MMKYVFFVASMFLAITFSFPRVKREAYDLPAGADEIIKKQIITSFSCEGYNYGYYADIENDCKIFHVCLPQTLPNGEQIVSHYSFFCGNQTVFNQLTLTCAFPEEAVPCGKASEFYNVNDNIGIEDALFLTDDVVQRANALIYEFGSRLNGK